MFLLDRACVIEAFINRKYTKINVDASNSGVKVKM